MEQTLSRIQACPFALSDINPVFKIFLETSPPFLVRVCERFSCKESKKNVYIFRYSRQILMVRRYFANIKYQKWIFRNIFVQTQIPDSLQLLLSIILLLKLSSMRSMENVGHYFQQKVPECKWQVGRVGNCPSRFWQIRRCCRAVQCRRAALLLAHSDFGSYLRP